MFTEDLANTDSSEDSDSDEKIPAPPAPKPNDEVSPSALNASTLLVTSGH